MCLELLGRAVRIAFDLENPHGGKDFETAGTGNEFPTVELVCQRVKFFAHRVIELFLMGSAHRHFKGRIILVVFGRSCLQNSRVGYAVDKRVECVGTRVGDEIPVEIVWTVH